MHTFSHASSVPSVLLSVAQNFALREEFNGSCSEKSQTIHLLWEFPAPLAASGLGRNIERSGRRHRTQAGLNEIVKYINIHKNAEPGPRHRTIRSKHPPHPGWISNHASSQITWLWKQNIGILVIHLFCSYYLSFQHRNSKILIAMILSLKFAMICPGLVRRERLGPREGGCPRERLPLWWVLPPRACSSSSTGLFRAKSYSDILH